jgi:hypothetical protein
MLLFLQNFNPFILLNVEDFNITCDASDNQSLVDPNCNIVITKWDVIYVTNYESPMNDAHVQIFSFLKSMIKTCKM